MDSLPLNSLTIAITGLSKAFTTLFSHYSSNKSDAKPADGWVPLSLPCDASSLS